VVEAYGFWFLIAGGIAIAVAWAWLLARAFRTSWPWGIGCSLFPPALLPFAVVERRRLHWPLLLLAGGVCVVASTYGVNYYVSHHVSLGPREKLVDGAVHVTLTGWDGHDYSILESRPQTAVLQMANPDVTDETLRHLRGLTELVSLDLNDTQITDAGLPLLSQLPKLETLRLRGTKITDNGFREFLAGKPTLREVDLRGTQVSGQTLRDWKTIDREHRKFLR
jgi:hypothetical protein